MGSKPKGLTDWAYETIKELILTLKVAPGTQLQIEMLADQMGVSRTPVREALLRLEQDGLTQVVPRVGVFVTDISKRDLEELYELRELLESRATEEAAQRLTDDDLDHIDRLLEESKVAVKKGNVEKFLETEIAFHHILTEGARNRRLISIMDGLRDLSYRWRIISLKSQENVRLTLIEHQGIAQALRQRDGPKAGKLMGDHIRSARERMIKEIDLGDETEVSSGAGA
ncbi:MAG TPA: GntR family transcriptional regulator [Anaerolineae bacterium]|nr:GntR family transcriptional regulator [Anaerolineae bacterium]